MRSNHVTVLLATLVLFVPVSLADEPSSALEMVSRVRVEDDAGVWQVQLKPLRWDARETAVIICDMWDDHYCRNSARRVAEMAPHMNRVIAKLRDRGALIIHCPSGCMDFYEDTPGRKLAQRASAPKTKLPLEGWCHLDPKREGELPIDDSVPCDDEKPRERIRFYSRQIETLEIKDGDAITDNAEVFGLMQDRGVKNVIVMGVHTNKCVLGRPFGIRQLVYQRKNVVLMRDMTDAMYNPRLEPKVPHVRGTELVVEHIERHWCPTIASTEITGEAPFRFGEDARPRVAFVVGGGEYDADETIPPFAAELRERHGYDCQVLVGRGKDTDYRIPGLDTLKRADLLVLFLRRRALSPEQLDYIRRFLQAGKPLIALRTSSHGFEVSVPPQGRATWDKFDVEVLGCDYRGHGPGSKGTDVRLADSAAGHAILHGVDPGAWHSRGSLYSSQPLADDARVLLVGSFDDRSEPIAWTRTHGESPVFYTSLGHPDDFQEPRFRKLLANAIAWGIEEQRPWASPGLQNEVP